MNKRLLKHGKKAFTALLVVCLMLVTLWGNSVRAEEGETVPAPVEVNSWDDLQAAMEQASDGDVIKIMNPINVPVGSNLGYSDKRITLQKGCQTGTVIFEWTDEPWVGSLIQNVVFDGAEIVGGGVYVSSNGNETYHNVSFINCYSESSPGALYTAGNTTLTMNYCTFENNKGLNGGHIMFGGSATLGNCILKNGYAAIRGGAICCGVGCVTLNDCIVTGNSAGFEGGGISNVQFGSTISIQNSKVYGNHADVGSDIFTNANYTIDTDLEALQALYEADGYMVTGWEITSVMKEENEYFAIKLGYTDTPVAPPADEPPTGEPITPPTDEPGTDTPSTDNPPSEQPSENPSDAPSDAPTGSPSDQGGTGGNNNQTTPPDTGNNGSSANNGNTGNPPSNNTPSNNSNSTVTSSDNSSTDTSDRSDNSTHTSNTTTTNDNSDRSTTTNNDTSDRSTVNNYYYTTTTPQAEQGQQSTSAAVNESDQNVGTASSDEENQEQGQENPLQTLANIAPNIKMDLKGVNCVLECDESGAYSISITSSDDDPVQNAQQESTHSELPWLNVVQIVLLAAILLFLIWQNKPRRQGNNQEQE